MRLGRLALVLWSTTLVQTTPLGNPPKIDGEHNLTSRDLPTGTVRWTLHKTCYQQGLAEGGDELRDAVIKSVNAAKDRSKLAVDTLNVWRDKCHSVFGNDRLKPEEQRVKKACQLLLGDSKYTLLGKTAWKDKIDIVKVWLEAASKIDGPKGQTNNEFENSKEWQDLAAQDDHWLNFIIYCAPDLGERNHPSRPGQKLPYDNGQLRLIREPDLSALVKMNKEYEAKAFEDSEGKFTAAITELSKATGDDETENSGTHIPKGDRKKIPCSITIHPHMLRQTRDREFNIKGEDDIKAAIKMDKPKKEDKFTPIDKVVGLTETIHHEFFHTPGLGRMTDGPLGPGLGNSEAYDWKNIVKNKDPTMPEYFMFLALLVDLTNKDIVVNEDGSLMDKSAPASAS
ncbi:hypothetical protein B0H66DRAFT_535042 [Apodospora peruviana]|uniref:Uncharacterized protein n=1 Tax=Apodospora peruviana TaxID=516989 RepID=A0AAE0M2E9_9PEZI|nr:hypothetical protein B0H66DRAFT_535042 [Apodospora peruviana]